METYLLKYIPGKHLISEISYFRIEPLPLMNAFIWLHITDFFFFESLERFLLQETELNKGRWLWSVIWCHRGSVFHYTVVLSLGRNKFNISRHKMNAQTKFRDRRLCLIKFFIFQTARWQTFFSSVRINGALYFPLCQFSLIISLKTELAPLYAITPPAFFWTI